MSYRKYLGPSEIPIILGCPYSTPSELKEKLENLSDYKETPKTKLGKKMEKGLLQKYRTITKNRSLAVKFKSKGRLGGMADGIFDDGSKIRGLEIKCQFYDDDYEPVVYESYIQQVVAYMFLYEIHDWEIMCARINRSSNTMKISIYQYKWEDYREVWENVWYPKIMDFLDSVDWKS